MSFVSAAPSCRYVFDRKDDGYLFGLEFTLTNQMIVNEGNRNPKDYSTANNPLKKSAFDKFVSLLKEKCLITADCTTSETRDKHGPALKVTFKDGYFFTVGIDAAVLEVNAKPVTRIAFRQYTERMQSYVFDLGRRADLTPHERAGQGHIHISNKAFNRDALLLRNFFVDFQNRPELIFGALGNHLLNSPPLAAQKPTQRENLVEVLKDLDNRAYSIDDFVDAIHSKVYTGSHSGDWGSYTYYQAFNMTRMWKGENDGTLEIRSFRPQRSPHEFELQTKLLERWIQKLRSVRTPVSYIKKDRYQFSSQEIVDAYAEFLKFLDLPYEEFKMLLPVQLQSVPPKLAP